MTGPEHYAEAERLRSLANTGRTRYLEDVQAGTTTGGSVESNFAVIGSLLAEAQVHATLALVAATVEKFVEAPFPKYTDDEDADTRRDARWETWRGAIS